MSYNGQDKRNQTKYYFFFISLSKTEFEFFTSTKSYKTSKNMLE